jgi:hypothetical protein
MAATSPALDNRGSHIRTGSQRRRRVDRHRSTMNDATIELAQVDEDILGYESPMQPPRE